MKGIILVGGAVGGNYTGGNNGRYPEIDIIKGIAIILVVLGHTFPPFREFIYLFHMSVFLMASGYCWKSDKIKKYRDLIPVVIKKLKSLYVPFVICNASFVLLNNWFVRLNIYSNDVVFLKMTSGSVYPQHLTPLLNLPGLIKELIKVFLGIGVTPLGSATWFLIGLLQVLIIHAVLQLIINTVQKKTKILIYIGVMFLLIILMCVVPYTELRVEVRRFPCLYFAFFLGILIKKIELNNVCVTRDIYNKLGIITSIVILFFMTKIGNIEVSAARIVNPFFFAVCSIAGWVLLMAIGKELCRMKSVHCFQRSLCYLGQHTMVILCLHLLAFKIVSLMYILINNEPRVLLASFHVIFNIPWYYLMGYTIVGITVPLMIECFYQKIKNSVVATFGSDPVKDMWIH